MKTNTAAKNLLPRRSKRQQGLEVTPGKETETRKLKHVPQNAEDTEQHVEENACSKETDQHVEENMCSKENELHGQETQNVRENEYNGEETEHHVIDAPHNSTEYVQPQPSKTKKRRTRGTTKMNENVRNDEENKKLKHVSQNAEETEQHLVGNETSKETEDRGIETQNVRETENHAEETDHHVTEAQHHSTEEGEAQPSNTKKRRRTRGPTKMNKVAKNHEDKVDVEFTRLGEHVGKGSVMLSSFLGPLVREHVPYTLEDWRYLDPNTKYTLWDIIQARFNLSKEWQKDCVFKQMGCIWRSSKSKLVAEVRSATSKQQILDLKPTNIHSVTAWTNWVKSRTSSSFQEVSDQKRNLRMNQIPQTTSRKGMVRLAHEMKKKSSNPSTITRSKVWLAGHTHSDGRPVKPEFEALIDKIKTIDSQMDSTSSSIRDDAVSQVLGKDKCGRVRGFGRGITASKLAFIDARDTHVEKLEATQADLIRKIENLQTMVHDLAGGKKTLLEHGSNSESSNVNSGGPRCKLLEWYSEVEVVVGEAEFCSAEPMYKIGCIPLGPNAAAVLVKSVSKTDASVWRPTSTISKLGEAVECKIAWPVDKIILDKTDSPNGVSTAGQSGTNALDEGILIFDWIGEDELIAEGSLYSTDPKELVNNIPLGPTAAIVTVTKVVKDGAFLWRPSVDMSFMGDALHEKIAWPIHKIQFKQPQSRQQSISKNTSNQSIASVSVSTNTDTSKGVTKKCILLACDGTGLKVAEGKVCSRDPSHVVHFAPLGPNATSVWVQVAKVRDAPVWRPNSEIEIIADAVGTRIAWPNDKLVFI